MIRAVLVLTPAAMVRVLEEALRTGEARTVAPMPGTVPRRLTDPELVTVARALEIFRDLAAREAAPGLERVAARQAAIKHAFGAVGKDRVIH